MFCSNCGKELPDGSNFCFACGAPVVQSETKAKETKDISKKKTTSGSPPVGSLHLKPVETDTTKTLNSEGKKESDNSENKSDGAKTSNIKILPSEPENTKTKASTDKIKISKSQEPKTARDVYSAQNNVETKDKPSSKPKEFKGRRTLGGLPGNRTASTTPNNVTNYSRENSASLNNNSQSSRKSNVPEVDLSVFDTSGSQSATTTSTASTTSVDKKPIAGGMKIAIVVAVILAAVLAFYFFYISRLTQKNISSSSYSSYSSGSSDNYSDSSYGDSSYSSDNYYSDSDQDSYSSDSNLTTLYASSAEWPFYDYFMRENFSPSSSSQLANNGSLTYGPSNVTDNDSNTAWIPSKSGSDIGEYLNLNYKGDSDYTLHRLYFLNGYTKDMDTFNKNTTPTELEFGINGEKVATFKLAPDPDPQVVELESPITLTSGDTLNFEITKAQIGPNDKVTDTAISDIRVE